MTYWQRDSLPAIADAIWLRLASAAATPGHPWRTPTLGTVDSGACRLRSVVLREVVRGDRTLVFYTDRRSPKVANLSVNPSVEWLFYDSTDAVQIRISARAVVHTGDTRAMNAWRNLPAKARDAYRTIDAPGTSSSRPTTGLPDEHSGADVDAAAASENEGRHFALVATVVHELDWVALLPSGNRRAHFAYVGGAWHNEWLVP